MQQARECSSADERIYNYLNIILIKTPNYKFLQHALFCRDMLFMICVFDINLVASKVFANAFMGGVVDEALCRRACDNIQV